MAPVSMDIVNINRDFVLVLTTHFYCSVCITLYGFCQWLIQVHRVSLTIGSSLWYCHLVGISVEYCFGGNRSGRLWMNAFYPFNKITLRVKFHQTWKYTWHCIETLHDSNVVTWKEVNGRKGVADCSLQYEHDIGVASDSFIKR